MKPSQLLRSHALAALGVAAFLCGGVPRTAFGAEVSPWDYDLQVGLDAWDIRPSVSQDTADNQSGNTRLFLANSSPYWPYESPAPWLKFEGRLRIHDDTMLAMRYRRDTSSGSRLDELSLDHSLHSAGMRIGVLDYKTSWCRTYDIDSPWVRENDPFCTVRFTSQSISAAPGVQAYVNGQFGDVKVQAIAGVYDPLKFDYASTEFTNTLISPYSKVFKNDKVGLSINLIDLVNAFNVRLSWLHTDQSAKYKSRPTQPAYRIDQDVDVLYTGVSFNPSAALTVRFTHLKSNLRGKSYYPSGWVKPDDFSPDVFYEDTSPKVSNVLELNYQAGARDVFSLAHSVYDLSTDSNNYRFDPFTQTSTSWSISGQFVSRTSNTSLSWRRDWQKGVFTVLQWTYADVRSSTNFSPDTSPPTSVSSNGTAIGLRLGYRF